MKNIITLLLFGVLLLLAAYNNEVSTPAEKVAGSLRLKIYDQADSRILLPDIPMEIVSYDACGSGPGGSIFEGLDFTETTVNFPSLPFGEWIVVVQGKNENGDVIGSGTGTVTVHAGEISEVAITISPLVGEGNMDITVNWIASDTDIPSIESRLVSSSSTDTDFEFTLN